jgi:hypothetical protein
MTDTNQKKVQITIPSDTVATFSNIAQVTVLDDSVIYNLPTFVQIPQQGSWCQKLPYHQSTQLNSIEH